MKKLIQCSEICTLCNLNYRFYNPQIGILSGEITNFAVSKNQPFFIPIQTHDIMNVYPLRSLLLFTLSIAIAALTGSCTHEPHYRIGVSQCSADDWRDKMNEEIRREAMFHDNIEIEIRSGDDDNAKQIADLEYFVNEGFDLIIAAPNEADALTPTIKRIYESGLPIIVFDRNVNGEYYTAYQGADNVEIGHQAALLARAMLGDECRVIEICGLEGSSPATDRQRGFDSAAEELGIKVLGRGNGYWNYEEGSRVSDSLLSLYPEANLIYAHNDRMAIAGAMRARAAHRQVKTIGIDAAPTIGIQAVADSIIDATFLYPTGGHELVRTAIAILEGKPYKKVSILPTPATVDATNAEMLLLQDQALREETSKISGLKQSLDSYCEKHSLQTAFPYSALIIIVLCAGLLFVVLRAYWARKRHHQEVEAQNIELAKQRDQLDTLYKQLQDATRSKLTFFTNVSHDLRTPLTLVAEPVHQLATATNLTEQQSTLMQLADKNVKRLQRLINQILDLRKYEDSKLGLSLKNVDLSEALREWSAAFEAAARKRHLHFSLTIETGQDYHTALDIDKIERVYFNILSNAFKFTPANGSIDVNLSRKGDSICLAVKDTGVGIPQEEISQIFDRFFKTDHINPTGSGIGLALSKVFVEMHQGTIAVESQPGKGSTFTVTLPVKQTQADTAADIQASVSVAEADVDELKEVEALETEPHENAPTILIIDDNPDIRVLIKSILSPKFTVLQASSGAQGIRLATKYIPDLIICDVMMPGIDGYETCRRLKAEEATPVLLLTACSLDEQRTLGYQCGVDAYMSKPFDSEMLSARCDSLIENRKRIYSSMGNTAAEPVAEAASQKSVPVHDIDNEFYQRFVAIVNDEIGNADLSVEELAQRLGLSRVQMYRKLKALTNYSPAELIRNLRLRRAAQMLKNSEMTVSEISYSVGFTSPSYFAKCYREYFNETPSEVQARTSKME